MSTIRFLLTAIAWLSVCCQPVWVACECCAARATAGMGVAGESVAGVAAQPNCCSTCEPALEECHKAAARSTCCPRTIGEPKPDCCRGCCDDAESDFLSLERQFVPAGSGLTSLQRRVDAGCFARQIAANVPALPPPLLQRLAQLSVWRN